MKRGTKKKMSNTEILFLKKDDDFKIEYEIINIENSSDNELKKYIKNEIRNVEKRIEDNNLKIQDYNEQIKKFTNQADGTDYAVAISSGILAGIIDSFFVGDFSLSMGREWTNQKVNKFVIHIAKKKGYSGEELDGAIRFLENRFKIPSDNLWSGKGINISPKSHHLDDLAHHFPFGLIFSILTQFTQKGYFLNSFGKKFKLEIKDMDLIGDTIYKKISIGVINWFFHLVSDMAGSSATAGAGMGIPGPLLSLMKELSGIEVVNKIGLSKMINYLFIENNFDRKLFKNEHAEVFEKIYSRISIVLYRDSLTISAFGFCEKSFNPEDRDPGNVIELQ